MKKYIFDFDDVLFSNTEKCKKHMYAVFEEHGVSKEKVKEYYKEAKEEGFVMRNLAFKVHHRENLQTITQEALAEKILKPYKNFANIELIEKIKKLNPFDCYMVTHGVSEYQREKITRTEVAEFFNEIFIVQDSKKDCVEGICKKFPECEVVFVDDKPSRFEDLDLASNKNLRTVLFTGNDVISDIFR